MNFNIEKKITGRRLIFVLFAVTLLLRLPTLLAGFYNPDETCYATIAQRLIEGKLLYIDIIDHKPPLIYYLYALFEFVAPGKTIYVAHAAMIAVVVATAGIIAGIGRRLGTDLKTAALAGLLYVIGASLGKPNDAAAANAELFFNLPIAACIYLVLNRSFFHIAIGGVMVGLAILIKPHAFFAVPAVLLYLLFDKRFPFGRRISNCTLFTVSVCAPLGLAVLYLYLLGTLNDAIYWGITVNSLYMSGHETGTALILRFIKQTAYMLFVEEGGIWLPIVAWLFVRRQGERLMQAGGVLVILWFLFSAAAIVPGQRFFGHYYLQILPPAAVLAAFTARGLCDRCGGAKNAVISAWLALLLIPLVHSWIWAWPIESLHARLESVENKQLVDYLRRETRPKEKIEVWGRFNGTPYLAGRENGTRFLNKNLLSGSFRSENLVEMPTYHWALYFSDLEKNKPEWFIDCSAVDMKDASVEKFPALANYISSNYFHYGDMDGNVIYKRKR